MKKGLISKLLIAMLVVGLLFSILPSQQAQAATLDVCPTCAYTTIQAAIDAAAPGDTINVAAGTYNENLEINKSLTLQGAGRETTIVQAVKGRNYNGGGTQSPVVDIIGDAATPSEVVDVDNKGVKIDGFTFHGNVPTTAQSGWATGGVNGLSTQCIQTVPEGWPWPDRENIQITNNKFVYCGSGAVLYNTTDFMISNNIGERASYEYTGFGFKPYGGKITHISGGSGVISNNAGFDPEGTISISGSDISVIENTITQPATPLAGDVDMAQYGISVMVGKNVSVERNIITGLKGGPRTGHNEGWPGAAISFNGNATSSKVGINYNVLTNNTIGLYTRITNPLEGPSLGFNQFNGNLLGVMNLSGTLNPATIPLNVDGNYWGIETGPVEYPVSNFGSTWAQFYAWLATNPAVPAGAVTEMVDFITYCTVADCTEIFAPPVHNIDQGTYFNTITAAVNEAVDGDEITVAAGVYDEENIIITKGITLQGAGATTTSIAPSVVTNNSTFIVRNPSGDVTIDGFNFVMQPKPSYGSAVVVEGQVIAVDSATVTISNNIVTGSDDGSKSDYGFYGQGNNAKVVITGNVINKTGDNPINFENQFGSTSVTNNTINITTNVDYNPYYSMVYTGTVSTPQIVEGNTFNLDHSGSGYAEAITFTTSPRGRWGGPVDDIGHYTAIQIKDNVINTGGPYARGVGIYDRSQGSGYGMITGAVITGNQIIGENLLDTETYGVTLRGDVQSSVITGNTISNVDIAAWIRPGEDAGGTCPAFNNDISMNQITSVTTNVKNDCASGGVDASSNWWGKADGPADGSIVGDVAYLPYCIDEDCVDLSKAKVYLTPETAEAACTDTEKDVLEVYVEDVAFLSAYEIQLNFDPSMIEILDADVVNGGFLDPLTGMGINPDPVVIDAGVGTVTFNWTAQGSGDGLSKPSSGTGSLVKISYKRTGNLAGTAAFTNLEVSLVGWEPEHEGENIEFDYTGQQASFTINPIVTNTSKIPNQGYCSLSTAVSGATSGDTLRADVDFDTTARVNVNKKIIFNTNGKTITRINAASAYDPVFYLDTTGNLTVNGGGALNSVSGTDDKFGAAIQIGGPVLGGTKVTLEEGTTLSGKYSSIYVYRGIFDMTGGLVTDGIAVFKEGRVYISGGTVRGAAPIMGNGSAGHGGTIITISGDAQVISDDSVAIYHPQNGTLNINGGTITGTNAIEMKAGKLVVTGGTITGTGPFVETPTAISSYSTDTGDAILLFSAPGYTGDLSVDIQGGTITSEEAYALREFTTETTTRTKSIEVSGGTLIGGLGTGKADEAVFFSTVDPTVLKLTGGRYNADPGDSPDYVYEPLDTYLHTDNYYHIMEVISGTFSAFTVDGVLVDQPDANTINFSGDIPWYNYQAVPERLQGNRVGMYVTEPAGEDLTGATIKIYRDGTLYYTGDWTTSKDATLDNFVPYWALVTEVPQEYTIEVQWNEVSKQTFTATVVAGSVLLSPPAPIISSTDIQGYYLAGDEREFNVSMKNPADGANYARMIFEYKLAGVTTADIDSFEYFAQDLNAWIEMDSRDEETYGNCADGTGVCGQFGWAPGGFGPVAAGFENTSQFKIKFNKGFAAPLAFTLDLSGKLDVADTAWTHLTDYTGTLDVHDKPVITVVTDPYFIVNEAGQFTVTISNPATGRNYGNNVVFDLVIPGHLPSDFESMSCGFGTTTWPVTLAADGTGGSTARVGGVDGYFNITSPFGPMTVNCTVTLKTSGDYSVTGKMTDTLATPELTDDRVIQTSSGEVKAYTKPTISATFPTGPIAAGVPVTVPVTITNPNGIPGPFALVLDLPNGATILYNGVTYLCGDDPLTEDVVEVGCPAIPVVAPLTAGELVITFPGNGTVDVTIELFDTAADPDRKLAEATITGVVIGGDYEVTGYVWLQGTSRRHEIPVIFTWGGTLVPYGPEFPTVDTDTVNLTATLTYGGEYLITTNQPRYLNVAASDGKTIDVNGNVILQPLRLLAGNAVWSDNLINVSDAQRVSGDWSQTFAADFIENCGDVNFDGKVNINDLALVGGNMGLGDTSLGEGHYVMPYASWNPVQ